MGFFQLVGLSVVVTVISIVLTQCHQIYEKNRDQERYEYEKNRDQERYQQTALENYFKEMTDIIVEKKLGILHHVRTEKQQYKEQDSISQSIYLLEQLEQKKTINKEQKEMIQGILKEIKESQLKELEAIARAQTLTTLNLLLLDRERRDLLINFLRETTLATKDPTCDEQDNKTSKAQAKKCQDQEQAANLLIGINLNSFKLPKIDLHLFILKKADFGNANLSQAFLSQADLRGSNLSGSNLSQASMINTNLREANLTKSDLKRANLGGANLTNANLTNADLTNATPPSLKSQYARPELAEQDFPNTYLCNTTMPNGYISKRDCEKHWQQKFD
jgi:uncharacterized protein YjbI with pentapeptide repeats